MKNQQLKDFGTRFHEAVLDKGMKLDEAYEYCRLDVEGDYKFRNDFKKVEQRLNIQRLAQEQFEKLNAL